MEYIQFDFADASSLGQTVKHIRSQVPTLAVLIANAGISRPENYNADHIETTTGEELLEVLYAQKDF